MRVERILYHVLWLLALATVPVQGQLYISEFLADNESGLVDEDGDAEDWIEVWNTSTQTVDLTGWSLTDDDDEPRKWNFPSAELAAGARRVVFASDKNRRNPLGEFHTNFKLSSGGEYLALVRPDNGLATVLDPYPPQAEDIAYGIAPGTSTVVGLALGVPVRWQVPTSSNDFAVNFAGWTNAAGFNDAGWSNAFTAVGYDTGTDYDSLFGAGGNSQSRNLNLNGSVFLRIPFQVTNRTLVTAMRYLSKHDDGFVVWLNGVRVAAEAAPADPAWNSLATANRDEALNNTWNYYPLTNGPALLLPGTNLLAIQGLNVTLNSSDLLVAPQLEFSYGANPSNFFYLTSPTPGAGNTPGSTNLGPLVSGVTDRPAPPWGTPDSPLLVVTARVDTTLRPLATNGVKLAWRIMYDAETVTNMTAAGGGLYTVGLPTAALGPGQMLRWRVIATDTAGYSNTAPRFANALDNDQYYGTVAQDPALTNSRLPVLHFFCTNFGAAASSGGTRCSLHHLGRFYDNVEVNLHGQTSSGFPKKPYDFDFNDDNRFLLLEGEEKVKDVNMLTDYADKTKARNTLAHETIAAVGSTHLLVSTVRVQTNGAFAGLWDLVEDGDNRWLERRGLNPDGALYKMYNFLNTTNATAAEKKWPQDQDKGDLQAFINGIHPAQALDDRRRFVYDNADIPACISYLVARSLISDHDHGHKNYYVYRDTGRTDEWSLLPWDVDLSFGHTWTGTYYDDRLFQDNAIQFSVTNWLYQILYQAPEINAMYLRRYRTCMERILQPPGTPTNQLLWERRLDELADLLDPPGVTNSDAILDWQKWGTWAGSTNNVPARTDIARVKAVHPPGRRDYLFNQSPLSSGQPIPTTQPAVPVMRFGDVEVNPASGNQAEEYFVIRNMNGYAVDLSGWSVTGAVRYTFRPGTVVPAGGGHPQYIGQIHVVRDPTSFRARASGARSNEFRFIVGSYSGQMSARGEKLYLVSDTGQAIVSTNWPAAPTAAQNDLRVTEVMYHPAPPTAAELAQIPWLLDSDFEFIELKNIGTNTLNLGGAQLAEGVAFTCPTNLLLGPGGLVVVAANTNAMLLRYGALTNVAGVFVGLFDNAGERVQLLDPVGEVVQDFTFNNTWRPLSDGLGFSLVPVDDQAAWDDWDLASQWRASTYVHGSPGVDDPLPLSFAPVLVTEALAHTDPPDADTVELLNAGGSDVDLGGWLLTDDFFTPRKFRIPTGTVLTAGARLTFTEAQFNTPSNLPTSFLLGSTGDDIWLFSADAATNLTGYYHGHTFGASPNGISFVRHLNSAGEEFFVLSSTNTLGADDAYPQVGPVVIAEIYAPAASNLAFVEVENLTASSLALHDPAFPTNRWRLRGEVDYDWPAGATLGATARVVVVGFDPQADTNAAAAFRSGHGIGLDVDLIGPWTGTLDQVEGHVKISRPDTPNTNEVPYVLVEDVYYRTTAPWPTPGAGQSLQRVSGPTFGSEPMNWFPAPARPGTASPTDLDTDGDGQPDWAEHLAGTNPSNAVSQLAFGTGTTNLNGMTYLHWPSQAGQVYVLEWAPDILADPAFMPIQTNIAAGSPATSWGVTNDGFYRVRLRSR